MRAHGGRHGHRLRSGRLADRYREIEDLARKLPDRPETLIERYRLLASLSRRLTEAKAASDLAGLAEREDTTVAEMFETLRDGIGQISGLLGLDRTVPGAFWKYTSLAADMAYNLTELRLGWQNVGRLEESNVRYAEAVRTLGERMRSLVERHRELRRRIEEGEAVEFGG